MILALNDFGIGLTRWWCDYRRHLWASMKNSAIDTIENLWEDIKPLTHWDIQILSLYFAVRLTRESQQTYKFII